MTIEQMQVQITATTDQFKKQLADMQKDIQSATDQLNGKKFKLDVDTSGAQKGLKDLTSGSDGFMAGMDKMVAGVSKAFAAIGAIFAVVSVCNWFVGVNAAYEKYQIQLRTVLKDANDAKAVFEQLRKFADITPFTTGEVMEAGTKLISSGAASMADLEKKMYTISDLASATGRSLTDVANVFARLKSGDFGEAFERLRDLNISKLELQLAGLRFDSSGAFIGSATQALDAVSKIVDDKYGGMTKNAEKSWTAIWSTFTSFGDRAATGLFAKIFDEIKVSLDSVNQSLAKFADSAQFEALRSSILGVWNACSDLLKTLFEVSKPLLMLAGAAVIGAVLALASGFNAINYVVERVIISLRTMNDLLHGVKPADAFAEADKKIEELNRRTATNNALIWGNKEAYEALKTQSEVTMDAQKEAAAKEEMIRQNILKGLMEQQKTAIQTASSMEKLAEQEAKIATAQQKNAVDITATKYIAAIQAYNEIAKAEKAIKDFSDQTGGAYHASAEYLDAKKKVYETLSAMLDAQAKQKDELDQYADATDKLTDQVKKIEQLGGDMTIAKYKEMKQAVTDYMASLTDIQKKVIEIGTSQGKISLALDIGKLKTSTEDAKEQVAQLTRFTESETNKATQTEINAINQVLASEKVHGAERTKLISQANGLYNTLSANILKGIQDTTERIRALAAQTLTTCNEAQNALNALAKAGMITDDEAMSRLQKLSDKEAAYYATKKKNGELTLKDIQDIATKSKEYTDKGIDFKVTLNTADYDKALGKQEETTKTQLSQAQKDLDALVKQGEEASKSIAGYISGAFADFTGQIQKRSKELSDILAKNDIKANVTVGVDTKDYDKKIAEIKDNKSLTSNVTVKADTAELDAALTKISTSKNATITATVKADTKEIDAAMAAVKDKSVTVKVTADTSALKIPDVTVNAKIKVDASEVNAALAAIKDKNVTVKVTADTTGVTNALNSIKNTTITATVKTDTKELDALKDKTVTVTAAVKVDTSKLVIPDVTVNAKIKADTSEIDAAMAKIKDHNVKIGISVDASAITTALDSVKNTTVKVAVEMPSTIISQIKELSQSLANIPKTTAISINVQATGLESVQSALAGIVQMVSTLENAVNGLSRISMSKPAWCSQLENYISTIDRALDKIINKIQTMPKVGTGGGGGSSVIDIDKISDQVANKILNGLQAAII